MKTFRNFITEGSGLKEFREDDLNYFDYEVEFNQNDGEINHSNGTVATNVSENEVLKYFKTE